MGPHNWSVPWSRVENVWYSFSSGSKGDWWTMESYCTAIEPGRTNMARVTTAKEHEHLTKTIKGSPYAWLGGGRVVRDKFFWLVHKTNGPFVLQPITTKYFDRGEPSTPNSQQGLLMYESGKWHDNEAQESYPAFC